MAEIGNGSGSNYPASLDTDSTQEVNTPNAGRTKARAEVVNDLASAIIAVQTELGTDPAGSLTDVKTYLQTEHNADGTHKVSLVGMLAGAQTFTGSKTFSAIMKLAKGADVASGTALALGADGNSFDITGTTAITSIQTVGVGTVVVLHFDGALTLTHHATDLILPTGANITTAAGDIGVFYEYATGDWRLIGYSRPEKTISGATLTAAMLASNIITEAKMDWANAGGISQSLLLHTELSHTGDTNWTEVATDQIQVYIPANANSLEYVCRIKTTGGAVTTSCRLAIGATDGTAVTTSSTSYVWSSAGTLDVSALSGWQSVDIDLMTSSGTDTAYVDRIAYRII